MMAMSSEVAAGGPGQVRCFGDSELRKDSALVNSTERLISQRPSNTVALASLLRRACRVERITCVSCSQFESVQPERGEMISRPLKTAE